MNVPNETFYFLLGFYIRYHNNLDPKDIFINTFWGFIVWNLFFQNDDLKEDLNM